MGGENAELSLTGHWLAVIRAAVSIRLGKLFLARQARDDDDEVDHELYLYIDTSISIS